MSFFSLQSRSASRRGSSSTNPPNFRRYYERSRDARLAIHQTLETTGRALLVTSLVLAAGFFTYLGAYLTNVKLFGALAGGAILVAFFANVILAPSLMVLATRRRA